MTNNNAVTTAIDRLSNALRLYGEAFFEFDQLFRVDKEEAINNLDRAFETKLEAFHTLCDVTKTDIKYFDFADTAFIIALRNGVHHRDHPLFHSLNARVYLHEDIERAEGAAYLIARAAAKNSAPVQVTHPLRMDDVRARMDPVFGSEYQDKRTNPNELKRRFELFSSDLGFPKIWDKARAERYPEDQIYLDVAPIFVSAVARIFPMLKAHGAAIRGYDAETYMEHFTSGIDIDLANPGFSQSRILYGGMVNRDGI